MTYDPNEWDAPDPPKLLISAKRVAAELDISISQANEICWRLDRPFYSPEQSRYRVTAASFDAFKALLEMGLSIRAAKAVMGHYKSDGGLPPADLEKETADRIYWRARQRW